MLEIMHSGPKEPGNMTLYVTGPLAADNDCQYFCNYCHKQPMPYTSSLPENTVFQCVGTTLNLLISDSYLLGRA